MRRTLLACLIACLSISAFAEEDDWEKYQGGYEVGETDRIEGNEGFDIENDKDFWTKEPESPALDGYRDAYNGDNLGDKATGRGTGRGGVSPR